MKLTFSNTIKYITFALPVLYFITVFMVCGLLLWLNLYLPDIWILWVFTSFVAVAFIGIQTKIAVDWWRQDLVPMLKLEEIARIKKIQLARYVKEYAYRDQLTFDWRN